MPTRSAGHSFTCSLLDANPNRLSNWESTSTHRINAVVFFFLIHMAHGFCKATCWKNITQILQDKQNPQSIKIKRTQSSLVILTVQHFWGVLAAHINTPASLVWLQAKTNNWKEKEKDSPAVSISFSEKDSIAGRQHFHPAINNHHEKRTLSS